MTSTTSNALLNQSIYQVFVRNYGPEGTFDEVTADLDRIKALGFDYLYLLPIFPIGKKNRKGTLGSPYAIRDYMAINPELGDLNSFKRLVKACHDRHMKVMLDIVFNHTAPDHYWTVDHPEYYYHREDGSFGNRVGDWSDIIDLDLSHPGLRQELINTLKYWAKEGVDAFRCDVASLLPLDFWLEARQEIQKVHPDHVWLAESVEPQFIRQLRSEGMHPITDSEVYQAFDCAYEYDILANFYQALEGKAPLRLWKYLLNFQQAIYPENAIKVRTLENHDQERIRSRVKSERSNLNCLAYSFFCKGMGFVYNGQEFQYAKRTTLFDKAPIDWNTPSPKYLTLLKRMLQLKKEDYFSQHKQFYVVEDDQEALELRYETKKEFIVGVFDILDQKGTYHIDLPDGSYINQINQEEIEIKAGQVDLALAPFIIHSKTKNA